MGLFRATEEALSLIKAEEVLLPCEYVEPPSRTSHKCSSEQEGKQVNSPTFNPHMTSKDVVICLKFETLQIGGQSLVGRDRFLFFELSIRVDFQWGEVGEGRFN